MKLALPADVRCQLGFDDMTDINFAIGMAMDAAEPYLAAQLNTEFDRGSFVDTFFVREPPFRDGPAVATEFRLRRGLVNSITSVLTSSDPTVFDDPNSVLDVTANTTLHPDKGLVKDFKTRYDRCYVQITYDAGFDVNEDGAAQGVPDWLQQACKIKTLIGLVDSPVLSEAQIKLDKDLLGTQLVSLLSRHLRYAPLSILPL